MNRLHEEAVYAHLKWMVQFAAELLDEESKDLTAFMRVINEFKVLIYETSNDEYIIGILTAVKMATENEYLGREYIGLLVGQVLWRLSTQENRYVGGVKSPD